MSGFAKARASKRAYSVTAEMLARLGDKLMTPTDVERKIGISRRQVGRLVARGELTPIRTGARYKIAPNDLARFLAGVAAT